MTFSNTAGTDIFSIRLEIGDNVENHGILPEGVNLQDEELQYFLSKEGHVQRAIAGVFEMLAMRWNSYPDTSVGPRKETYSGMVKNYIARAKQLRERYGYADDTDSTSPVSSGFVSVPVVRQDGYSHDETDYEFPDTLEL